MEPCEHPLRRRYALELTLGFCVVLLGSCVLLRRKQPGNVGTQQEPARPNARVESARREPVAPPGESLRGVLEGSGVLDVLVLDSSGRPAPAVPLVVDVHPYSSGPHETVPSLQTDENGHAAVPLSRFADADRLARLRDPCNVLHANVPLEHAPAVEFGKQFPRPGEVTLVLPPAGRVLMSVRDAEGGAVAGEATVDLVARRGLKAVAQARAAVRGGVAEFPWVDLDTELELKAFADDQRTRPSPSASRRLRGPMRAGEIVEGELTLGREWPLITFRALDEEGRALAWANLRLRLSEEPLSPQLAPCVTDGEGRGELRVLGDHRSKHVRQLELALEQPVARSARLDLPVELALGSATDLGDIVLRARR